MMLKNIHMLTEQVYMKYQDDPVDACWHATQELKELLLTHGIHGHIVKGDILLDWGGIQGSIQHHWIVVNELILDPTMTQLDNTQYVLDVNHEEAKKYDIEAEWTSF